MEKKTTLADVMEGDLFTSSKGDLVEGMAFLERHAVPLNPVQVAGLTLLQYLDQRNAQEGRTSSYGAIGGNILELSRFMCGPNVYLEFVDKHTLGDRVKGNVRLAALMNGQQGQGGK